LTPGRDTSPSHSQTGARRETARATGDGRRAAFGQKAPKRDRRESEFLFP
jgi:hypothetical protein